MNINKQLILSALIWLPYAFIQAPFAQASDDISVHGNRLEKNGTEWIPLGFTFDAFIAPLESLKDCKACEQSVKEKIIKVESARKKFSLDSIQKAKSLGSNIIRLQISQPGLDPKTSIFSDEYRINLEKAIKTIRDAGLIVMLSMTHGDWAGLKGKGGFPDDSTFNAWSSLKPILINDKGIILEIYNEPYGPNEWAKWQTSHQNLIEQLRGKLGLKNVFIVNGLKAGRLYDEAPELVDPMNQLAYGVHPYLAGVPGNNTESDWEKKWGWVKNNKPLIVTEWNTLGIWPGCYKNIGNKANHLIDFLITKKIGMIGWAFDIDGSIFDDKGIPTDLDNISCDPSSKNGGGKLIIKAISSSK